MDHFMSQLEVIHYAGAVSFSHTQSQVFRPNHLRLGFRKLIFKKKKKSYHLKTDLNNHFPNIFSFKHIPKGKTIHLRDKIEELKLFS